MIFFFSKMIKNIHVSILILVSFLFFFVFFFAFVNLKKIKRLGNDNSKTKEVVENVITDEHDVINDVFFPDVYTILPSDDSVKFVRCEIMNFCCDVVTRPMVFEDCKVVLKHNVKFEKNVSFINCHLIVKNIKIYFCSYTELYDTFIEGDFIDINYEFSIPMKMKNCDIDVLYKHRGHISVLKCIFEKRLDLCACENYLVVELISSKFYDEIHLDAELVCTSTLEKCFFLLMFVLKTKQLQKFICQTNIFKNVLHVESERVENVKISFCEFQNMNLDVHFMKNMVFQNNVCEKGLVNMESKSLFKSYIVNNICEIKLKYDVWDRIVFENNFYDKKQKIL